MLSTGILRSSLLAQAPRSLALHSLQSRLYASKNDITQIPLKLIGVLGDYYVPPKILSAPIKKWPRLLVRKIGMFGLNTYSAYRYRLDTKLKLRFNDWKEHLVENYVKTNKVFADACSLRKNERLKFIRENLFDVSGEAVINSLAARALTFPANTKCTWKLKSVESNPKIVTMMPVPDSDDVTAYAQIVTKVTTKQEMTITPIGGEPQTTERSVTDYLVGSLNPYTQELYFVGTLFEADYERGLQPEEKLTNLVQMEAFQKKCADIYRVPPKAITA